MSELSRLVWHRRMLFGTVSRNALTFAHAVRPTRRKPAAGGKTETGPTKTAVSDVMPFGWPRCDVAFTDRETANRYRASIRQPLIQEPPANDDATTNAVRFEEAGR